MGLKRAVGVGGVGLLAWACAALMEEGPEPTWWRGNTHTHTLWSDGDGAPRHVVGMYRARGYDFLVLTDHNVLSRGERWFPVTEEGRLTPERVAELDGVLGTAELRAGAEGTEMRLANLEELRAGFGGDGAFLLIEGEEISSSAAGKPIHVNGLNLAEVIPAVHGEDVRATLVESVASVHRQGERLERRTLAHVNHPNFGAALDAGDLAAVPGTGFFEVYNGHPAVANGGGAGLPDTETLWDRANTARLAAGAPLLYGVATDDTHHVHERGPDRSNAFRGWVMVRAPELTAEALLAAMERGDFYATTGVTLEDVSFVEGTYTVRPEERPGVTYRTTFVGLREGASEAVVLGTTSDVPAVYRCVGDERFLRARVVSSELQEYPLAETPGDVFQTAWLQPVRP